MGPNLPPDLEELFDEIDPEEIPYLEDILDEIIDDLQGGSIEGGEE